MTATPLKKALRGVICAAAAMLLLCGCSGNSAAIDRMVDELNSPVFRAAQAKTGLFDDTQAKVEGKQLIIKFLCRPYINLGTIDKKDYAELEAATVTEFQAHLIDPEFKEGLEALRAEGMTILLDWQDINGFSIKIPVDPARILDGNK